MLSFECDLAFPVFENVKQNNRTGERTDGRINRYRALMLKKYVYFILIVECAAKFKWKYLAYFPRSLMRYFCLLYNKENNKESIGRSSISLISQQHNLTSRSNLELSSHRPIQFFNFFGHKIIKKDACLPWAPLYERGSKTSIHVIEIWVVFLFQG